MNGCCLSIRQSLDGLESTQRVSYRGLHTKDRAKVYCSFKVPLERYTVDFILIDVEFDYIVD